MYLVRIKYLFFLIIFFVGILIYKDYGISWDKKNKDRFIYVGKNLNYQGSIYNDGKTIYEGEYYIFVLNRWNNFLEHHSINSKKILEIEIDGTVVNGLYQVKM